MNRISIRLILDALAVIGIALFLLSCIQKTQKPEQTAPKALPEGYRNGAWIWESPKDLSEKEFEERILFAREKNIKVVYLFMESYLSIIEDPRVTNKEKALETFEVKVRKLLSIAYQHGIEVEALAGNVDWAEPSHAYIPRTLFDYVLDFNARTASQEKFAGIQFDIEFYNQKGFKKNTETLSNNYLSLAARLSQKLRSAAQRDFRLGFTVPYNLSDKKGPVPATTFNQSQDSVLGHLLDILQGTDSYLIVMAYRNRVPGPNGILDISKNTIDLADTKQSDVEMYVGLETQKNNTESITFYGMSQGDVNNAAAQIASAYSASGSFSGVSIHTLLGYMSLQR